MTAYRDRMLAGEYDPASTDSGAKAQKKAATRAVKSTTLRTTKRSTKK